MLDRKIQRKRERDGKKEKKLQSAPQFLIRQKKRGPTSRSLPPERKTLITDYKKVKKPKRK